MTRVIALWRGQSGQGSYLVFIPRGRIEQSWLRDYPLKNKQVNHRGDANLSAQSVPQNFISQLKVPPEENIWLYTHTVEPYWIHFSGLFGNT